MSKKTWKMEYWPAIITEATKDKVRNGFPTLYIYNESGKQLMEELCAKNNMNVKFNGRNNIQISTPEIMQVIVDNYESLLARNHYMSSLKRYMKQFEILYLHKAAYSLRMEGFNALDTETNS